MKTRSQKTTGQLFRMEVGQSKLVVWVVVDELNQPSRGVSGFNFYCRFEWEEKWDLLALAGVDWLQLLDSSSRQKKSM
jgi:hypothetical protein